ncbi:MULTISPECIES: rhomboid family intramembrane serine protease GlpG [unclassified Arsukibacterium]|uniref:rhomboid family intramembrane serine protease GlpG n=1 Tax=unclassified Arsukibacterium TaxID=2635278 RepID=UPI000C645551|nr:MULTISPECIES: rhomboid family intramembrane serine protease GlpG [unclassified Arsukibacterium]MAA93287.1 rhomboid family intramembrane serine protease GlpG [Rheinheimera sp.]MBM34221.1 rhomboid family intramembrane serine protease GlpG [Rheinheimera sp.]HAW92220.1 rhomboid family intramembrane serine protease GlpG [Candidatus Azambacteria bacterium]|tara:strand:+ start:83415 stop:84236 length:822 start_codon:yes stop_codon:yes gene_type:complete
MMHKLAEINNLPAALLFTDYCQSKGLHVIAEPVGNGAIQLYCDEDCKEQVTDLLKEFIAEPGHPRYQAAAWQRSQPVTQSGQRNFSVPWQKALSNPVTVLILGLCLLVYAWLQLDFRGATASLQLTAPAQLWRWFTPALLHFTATHLVFNLLWWLLLAAALERQFGSIRLLNFTVLTAVISNAAQFFLVGTNFGGLSGVVYALFGFCWLSQKRYPMSRPLISDALAIFMVVWLLLGFADVLWISMANWAHLAGMLTGLILALLIKPPGVTPKR